MKYKFVDIGTCFFATSIDDFGLEVNGLLVEPIKEFLEAIPSSPTIKKEPSGISNIEGEQKITTYFDPNLLKTAKLEYITHKQREDLRRKGKMKDWANNILPNSAISSLIKERTWDKPIPPHKSYAYTINTITLLTLIEKYNINYIEYLRIDTEGYDYEILKQTYNLLKSNKLEIENIQYEFNPKDNWGTNSKLSPEVNKILELGYKQINSNKDKEDIILIKL